MFHMKEAEAQNYTPSEIYAAVIKAIEPGNPLRDVLELESEEFDKDELIKSLRSHYNERDPGSILNELRLCVQGPKETAHKFCCRAVALKKKVKVTSEAEGLPVDEGLLKGTFFKTILTGLKQNNIRNELRDILKSEQISDADLLVEVSVAATNEQERLSKQSKEVEINRLNTYRGNNSDSSDSAGTTSDDGNNSGYSSSAGKKKGKGGKQKGGRQNNPQGKGGNQNKMLNEFSKITDQMTDQMTKLSASNAMLTAQVNNLQKQVTESTKPHPGFPYNPTLPPFIPVQPTFTPPTTGAGFSGRKKIFKCENCAKIKGSYCKHCFKCGSGDHRAAECTKN